MVHTLQFLKRFVYNMLYLPSGLSLLITNKNTTPQINIFPTPTPFFFNPSPSLPYFFHPSPFRLHSVFLPVPFSPSLLFRYIHSTCAELSLSPHSTFYTFFFSFHPIPVFSFLVPTSKSRHHFSFFCTFSPQVLRNLLCHTSLILPVVSGFFDSFPSFLSVCIFVLFTQLYIHPSSFL
jgi:hypothetical protein